MLNVIEGYLKTYRTNGIRFMQGIEGGTNSVYALVGSICGYYGPDSYGQLYRLVRLGLVEIHPNGANRGKWQSGRTSRIATLTDKGRQVLAEIREAQIAALREDLSRGNIGEL